MIDVTGKRFGELTVLGLDRKHHKPNGQMNNYWECQCDCGRVVVLAKNILRNRTTCGHEAWTPLSLTEIDTAYLAGLIDGEGCIGLTKVRKNQGLSIYYQSRFSIGMSDGLVLHEFHELTRLGTVQLRPPQKEGWKSTTIWQVSSTGLRHLLTTVQKYLRVKRRQADLVCEYLHLSQFPPRRNPQLNELYLKKVEQLYIECKRLNKRGTLP